MFILKQDIISYCSSVLNKDDENKLAEKRLLINNTYSDDKFKISRDLLAECFYGASCRKILSDKRNRHGCYVCIEFISFNDLDTNAKQKYFDQADNELNYFTN
ncbi:MAG: hypothetical protein Terrestrivirus11_37 [Terrestrivirus sp.]|uniref:Uncharacterized protein n=1 Tax=Terrestrivirus sp. TaxID=2487775 RepID=A0A3G4ZP89_9VIRU|nr:MAG: hypothetical protein Terrestrivirus11_37 [Terrestrivirus sp.]